MRDKPGKPEKWIQAFDPNEVAWYPTPSPANLSKMYVMAPVIFMQGKKATDKQTIADYSNFFEF